MGIYILYAILIFASIWDWRTYKIPNALSVFGILSGLIVSYFEHGFNGVWHSFISMLIVFAVLFPVWALSNAGIPILGAGDVKLFMVISTFIPYMITFKIVYLSIIIGAFIFIFLISPKKIISMFKNIIYLTFYYIPNIKEENLKKISFSFPIFLAFLIQTHILS